MLYLFLCNAFSQLNSSAAAWKVEMPCIVACMPNVLHVTRLAYYNDIPCFGWGGEPQACAAAACLCCMPVTCMYARAGRKTAAVVTFVEEPC